MSLRVCIDARFLLCDNRGMGRYVRGMLRSLFANHSDNDFLFAYRCGEASKVTDMLKSLGAGENIEMQEFTKCNRSEVDVFWFPWNRVDIDPKSGVVAVTIHDIAPIRFAKKTIWNALDSHRAEARTHNAIHRAELIMTVSNASVSEIKSFEPELKTKISVVYPGLDFTFDTAKTCSKPIVNDEYLLFVGADDERKNIIRLIEAYSLLRKDNSIQHKLVLCGLGISASCKYMNLLKKNDVACQVIFLDNISDKELCGLYAGASTLIFPSLYEGFGFPVLEAMACGTPVVCSNIPALSEVAGDAALFCDPENLVDIAEKTARCLKDTVLRGELIQKGLACAQKFTWERSASMLLYEFQNLAKGRK